MKKHPLVRGLGQEIGLNLREELRAWLEILRTNWLYASVAAVVIGAFVVKFNPLPPSQVFLGTGQQGSSYRQLGAQFTTYFNHYGIDLQTVNRSERAHV